MDNDITHAGFQGGIDRALFLVTLSGDAGGHTAD
jgi:hypothetical protein